MIGRFALGLLAALALTGCEGVPPRWRADESRYPLPPAEPSAPTRQTTAQEDALSTEIRRIEEELQELNAFEETTTERVEHLQYLVTIVPQAERAAVQSQLDLAKAVRQRQVRRRMELLDRLEGLKWRRYELRYRPLDE